MGWPANFDLVIGKARTLGRSRFLRLESEAINWRGRHGKSQLCNTEDLARPFPLATRRVRRINISRLPIEA